MRPEALFNDNDEEEVDFDVGLLGFKCVGNDSDGNAFDNLFNALSPADCVRLCFDRDCKAADMDDMNRPGSAAVEES